MKTTREIAKTVVAETLTHGGILVEPTVLHAANRWLVASIESALQQAIADEREAVWREVLAIAETHLNEPGFGYLLRDKLLRAAAIRHDSTGEEGS